MRYIKSLIATAVLAVAAFTVNAQSLNGFSCDRVTGNRVCTATLISGTATVAGPLKVENCDKALSLYRRSSAASNTSTSIAVGPDTAISATVAAAATASTTASRTDITTGGQCYVWATITPVTGATESNVFKVIESKNNTYRVE